MCHICYLYQGEIDAREDSFKTTAEAGQVLLEREHYAAEEVKEKLVILATEKTSLLSLWEQRRILYEQCMDLQLFYRDTEQADTWMAKQEVSIPLRNTIALNKFLNLIMFTSLFDLLSIPFH